MVTTYLNLTKPRLALMNVAVAAATFIFASPGALAWDTLAFMAAGLAGVVGAACVCNNYADRNLDAKMPRTKNRGLATGHVKPAHALVFGAVLLTLGVGLLSLTHILALGSALLGFFVYVFLYTPLKPRSGYALYVGAVAGATPVLVGYAAAAHRLDMMAFALFTVLFLWQIPHFLAIARYRFEDYASGGVPLLVTRPQNEQEKRRARKIFYWSLVFLVLFCAALILQRCIR